MATVLGLPEPKCENIIKSIIHILRAHGMSYSKQKKKSNFDNTSKKNKGKTNEKYGEYIDYEDID